MKRRIMAFCLAITVMLATVGCGAKSECKELIGNLESACNEMDINGVLDCFHPDKAAPFKMIVNTIGTGAENVANFIYGILGITGQEGENSEEAMETFKLEPVEYDLADETGTVDCKLSFEMGDSIVEKDLVFEVVKIDDQWYIDGLK